jgi:hypothetical protein
MRLIVIVRTVAAAKGYTCADARVLITRHACRLESVVVESAAALVLLLVNRFRLGPLYSRQAPSHRSCSCFVVLDPRHIPAMFVQPVSSVCELRYAKASLRACLLN